MTTTEKVFSLLVAAANGSKFVEINTDKLMAVAMMAEEEAYQSIRSLVTDGKLKRIPGHVGRTGFPLYWINHVAV